MIKHNVLMPIIIKLKVKRDIMKLKSLNIFVLAMLLVVGGFFLNTTTASASCDPSNPNVTPPSITSVNPPTGNYDNPGNISISIRGQGGYECEGNPSGGLGNDMVNVSVIYSITNSVGVSMFENSWSATPCNVPICVPRTINVNDSANANTWPAGAYTITAQASGAGGDSGEVTANFTITRPPVEPTPMSGTLTPASSTCTIASGASSCTKTLTWTTTNPVATSAVTNNGTATPASSSGNNSSANFTVPYKNSTNGATDFFLYNNAQLLATATVTTVCTSGTNWNGSSCAPSGGNMSGTLTPASSTCTIASGASSCTKTLTWTTTNPVATSAVTNNGTATPASSSGNNSSANFTVPYKNSTNGATDFFLYNNAQLLATATVTTVCTSGTNWNGSSCAPSGGNMSGTLTPASSTCTIASGASSCTSTTLSWTTTNPEAISSVTNNGGATPSSTTGLSGSQAFTVPYNTNMDGVTTFYLYNNAQQLATATVSTVCTSGTTWNGLNCGIGVGSGGDTEITRNNIFPNLDSHVSFLTSGLNQDIVVNHGETTFFLYHNIAGIPTILSQYTINARCADGSVWNGIDRCVDNNLPPVNGVCATPPNGGSYTIAPLGPLCSAGTANPFALSGKGDWNWVCEGTDGGSNASCSATQAPVGCAVINAAPITIFTGGSTKLTWSSCATSCSGTNFDTGGEANNSTGVSISPLVSTTYAISCDDKTNSTASVNVIVKKKPILIEN